MRRSWPDARIGWVVERHFAPIVESFEPVDEVLPVDLKSWRRKFGKHNTWREVGSLLTRIREFDADLVVDAMGNHKAGLLAALTFCDRRIGAEYADRREPSSAMWLSEPTPLEGEHAIDRALSLAAALGIEPQAQDRDCSSVLEGPALKAPPVLIHPGAGWRNKEYPPALWGRVSQLLREVVGSDLGVVAGPGEEELAHSVAAASEGTAEVIEGGDLRHLAGLMRGAELVLAGDTGPLHLAEALGRPVVCVLGPTDPDRNGVYSPLNTNLVHQLPCSFCYKRLDEAKACLLSIPPERIANAATRQLQAS